MGNVICQNFSRLYASPNITKINFAIMCEPSSDPRIRATPFIRKGVISDTFKKSETKTVGLAVIVACESVSH